MTKWDDRSTEAVVGLVCQLTEAMREVEKQLAIVGSMIELNKSLQRLVETLASRVVEQSELLSRRAEK